MTEFRSVPAMFLHRIAASPDDLAFRFPVGDGWQDLSWSQTGERVRAIACGLRALGIQPEQRCAIVSSTRLDWILADLGILCAGAATTTVYPASTAEESGYILRDSGTVVAFAEDAKQIAKLRSQRGTLPALRHVIAFERDIGLAPAEDDWVLPLGELERTGAQWHRAHPGEYEAGIAAVRAEQLATLIYTSGTTGMPKGVELTHDCWVYEGKAIDDLQMVSKEDLQYLWLPLAHVFGKVLQAAQIRIGFPTAVDGRIERLVDNLAVIKPTFIAAVPRIFEKVHNKIVTGAQAGSKLKYAIFKWAFAIGHRVSTLRQRGEAASGVLALQHRIADALVFSKVKQRFGGRVRFFISGSAPLSREIAQFFHAADILILEGYGLTETSAASCVNRETSYKFGTVGPPLPGTQVRIAADGEVLLRGRGCMRGYHGQPEATAETIDAEGWLHTGDIGELGADGFLAITDRKKDLIKTSGGKYIAPQEIEGKLKAICPWVAAVLVHGNNRNFCSALITLAEEELRPWAAQHGLAAKTYADLAAAREVRALIQVSIDALNRELPHYATIRKFALLPTDLTVEAGELTPSLKIKRKAVETKYKTLLDGLYQDAVVAM